MAFPEACCLYNAADPRICECTHHLTGLSVALLAGKDDAIVIFAVEDNLLDGENY